jgi:hypothetical protein
VNTTRGKEVQSIKQSLAQAMPKALKRSTHKPFSAGITKKRNPAVCSRRNVDSKRRLVCLNIMTVFSRQCGPDLFGGQYDREEYLKVRTDIRMAICWALSGTAADSEARATITTALQNLSFELPKIFKNDSLDRAQDLVLGDLEISFDPCDLQQEELYVQLAKIFTPGVFLNRKEVGDQLLNACSQECKEMLMRQDGSSQAFLERILSHDWEANHTEIN